MNQKLFQIFFFALFYLGQLCGCTEAVRNWVRSDASEEADPALVKITSTWDFSNSASYSFDDKYVEVTNGKASLKQVDQIHSGIDFNSGSHVGTYVDGIDNISLLQKPMAVTTHVNTILPGKAENLVGYWRMDGSWSDVSGSDTTSIPVGNSSIATSSKIGTHTGNFDGSGDYIDVGTGNILNPSNSLSVSAWVRRNQSLSNFSGIFSSSKELNEKGYLLVGTATNKVRFYIWHGSWAYAESNNVLDINQWSHLLGTWDGVTVRLYINGSLQTLTGAANSIVYPSTISNTHNIGNYVSSSWPGNIDDLAIWDTALTGLEIENLFSAQNAIYTELSASWTPKWTNLIGYWKMNGNWKDFSSNKNHGIASGNAAFTFAAQIGSHSGTFDGTGDYVISNWTAVTDNDSRSLAIWFKTNSSINTNFVSWGTAGNNQMSQIGIFNGGIGFLGFTNDLTVDSTPYTKGTWNHLIFTFDGINLKLFMNGVLVGSKITTLATNASFLNIGRSAAGGYEYSGDLDDLGVWNQPLSPNDVKIIYNRQKQKYAGHYDSPIIDLGSSGPWTNLNPTTTLPYYKELTGSSGSESSSNYSSLSGDLKNELVGLWSFNEISWNGTPNEVRDSSGNDNHGTIFDNTQTTSKAIFRGAAVFDGDLDTILLGDVNTLDGLSQITIASWAKWEGSFNGGGHITRKDLVFALGSSWSSNSTPRFWIHDGGWVHSGDAATKLDDGLWHFILGRYTGNSLEIWVDGKLENSISISTIMSSNANPLSFGSNGSIEEWTGKIDELAIWNRALSATEIEQLYRRGANRIKYQVKICVDSNCNCSAYSGGTPDTNDCNGNDVTNNVDPDQTGIAQWLGNNGPGSNFSELQNCTSIDGSNGECNGQVNTASPNFDFSNLSNVFPSVSQPNNNRYFQYRVLMESEDNSACSGLPCMPELNSVEIGPKGRYYGGSPEITPTLPVSYTIIENLIFTETGSCSLTYQLSPDGSTYYYWNDPNWVSTIDGVGDSTSGSIIGSNISSFTSKVGPGSLHWKAFITSDPTQSCEIDKISVTTIQ